MKNLDTAKLKNAEHLSFMTDLLDLLKTAKAEPLKKLKTKFEKVVADEELSQKEIKKSLYTSKLIELDKKRDEMYKGLLFHIKGNMFSLTDSVRAAATEIMLIIDTYGNFTTHNYQRETTEIQNFIVELKSDKYKAFVDTAGIKTWVNWLEAANNKFHEAYMARRDEYALRPNLNTKEIRKDGDLLFKEFQKITEALELLHPSEELEILLAKANASIDKWNEVFALRVSKTGKEDKMEEMPTNEEEEEKPTE